jgi:integrase/recombinase XerD
MFHQLDDFACYLASEKGASLHTVEAYIRDTIAFVEFLMDLRIRTFSSATRNHIEKYLGHLRAAEYAGSSVNRALMAIKVLFRFLKREGYIPTNLAATVDSSRQWQLVPEVLTSAEVEELLAAPNIRTERGARDHAILEVLYACGLRVSELCYLNICDVSDTHVKVMGKGRKERVVPIGQKAIEAINIYSHYRDRYGGREKALFVTKRGKRLGRRSVWKRIKIYAAIAGIKKNISPHTLRHSFATHLLDNQAELRVIQEMLGHSNISSTERYTHISQQHLMESFTAFHPRI